MSASTKQKASIKKEKVNRFKRQKTSRSEIMRESVSVNGGVDEPTEEAKDEETENEKLIKKAAEFEGFLLRKIGHKTDKIAEKMYFRLVYDQLEFSKIEQAMDEMDESAMYAMHSANILGSISIEHIKSVQTAMNGADDEFVLVFNENNPNSDWLLKTAKSERGNAQKWVDVLQRAQSEAVQIVKIINSTREDEEDETESDSDDFGRKKRKKKKIGGSIKALQKMINDETILELETARNEKLESSKNLVNGFEINSLQNDDENEQMLKNAKNAQACACCLVM